MKKLVLFVVCIFTCMALSGCARLFDGLNFARTSLPNLPSVPSSDLQMPKSGQKAALTEQAFAQILTQSNANYTTTREEINVSWQNSVDFSTNQLVANTTGVTFSYVQSASVADGEVYAQLSAGFSGVDNMSAMYFAPDYVVMQSTQLSFDVNGTDYTELFYMFEYEFVQNGSMVGRVMNAVYSVYAPMDMRISNGKEVYFGLFYGKNAQEIGKAVAFDYTQLGQNVEDLLAAEVSFDKDADVLEIMVDLFFLNEMVRVVATITDITVSLTQPIIKSTASLLSFVLEQRAQGLGQSSSSLSVDYAYEQITASGTKNVNCSYWLAWTMYTVYQSYEGWYYVYQENARVVKLTHNNNTYFMGHQGKRYIYQNMQLSNFPSVSGNLELSQIAALLVTDFAFEKITSAYTTKILDNSLIVSGSTLEGSEVSYTLALGSGLILGYQSTEQVDTGSFVNTYKTTYSIDYSDFELVLPQDLIVVYI